MTHQHNSVQDETPRNTIPKKVEKGVSRARGWTFTIWNTDTEVLEKLYSLELKVIGFQSENCPSTGREHLQGFIYYKNPRSFNSVKKVLKEIDNSCHIEKMRKHIQANIQYCSKNKSANGRVKYLRNGDNVLINVLNGTAIYALSIAEKIEICKQNFLKELMNDEEMLKFFKSLRDKMFINDDLYKKGNQFKTKDHWEL